MCAAVAADCACERLRRAARAISRLYGSALADLGLTATQLAILVATRPRGFLPLSRLAEGLHLDRTSLYRAVRPLGRRGYLHVGPGRNERERVASVTAKGERILQQALPVWETTQRRFVDAFGARKWAALAPALRQVVSIVQTLDPDPRARHRGRPASHR